MLNERKCAYCGAEIKDDSRMVERDGKLYCSRDCEVAMRKRA